MVYSYQNCVACQYIYYFVSQLLPTPRILSYSICQNCMALLHALTLLTACMRRGYFIHKKAHQPISAVRICFCVYAHHTGYVREVPKICDRDCNMNLTLLRHFSACMLLSMCSECRAAQQHSQYEQTFSMFNFLIYLLSNVTFCYLYIRVCKNTNFLILHRYIYYLYLSLSQLRIVSFLKQKSKIMPLNQELQKTSYAGSLLLQSALAVYKTTHYAILTLQLRALLFG